MGRPNETCESSWQLAGRPFFSVWLFETALWSGAVAPAEMVSGILASLFPGALPLAFTLNVLNVIYMLSRGVGAASHICLDSP